MGGVEVGWERLRGDVRGGGRMREVKMELERLWESFHVCQIFIT